MPRGGFRKGAGRKSTWVSGCTREDTKPIRVPKVIADKVLEIARYLDAGNELTIDVDTQSIVRENHLLKAKVKEFEDLVTQSNRRVKELEDLVTQSNQRVKELEDLVTQSNAKVSNEFDIKALKQKALSVLNMGSQAATYKKASKVLDTFIKLLEE